jgi:hypothetical protein
MTDSTLGLRMGKILLRQSREHGSLDRRSVQGLVGLPQSLAAEEGTPMVAPPPDPPPVAASQEPPSPPAGSAAGNGPGLSTVGLVTFLSFLCGGLAMALAVVLTWVEGHRRELTSPAPSPPARPVDVAPPPPVAPVPATPGLLTLPEPSPRSTTDHRHRSRHGAEPQPLIPGPAGTPPHDKAPLRAPKGGSNPPEAGDPPIRRSRRR